MCLIRNGFAAAACLVLAGPVWADDEAAPENPKREVSFFGFSANVAAVTDYRFRGVSLSDETAALQGGFDVTTKPGFYFGFWGSTIDEFAGSELEADFYGGYEKEIGGVTLNGSVILYAYPGSSDTHYWELQGSVAGTLGPVGAKVGAYYAFAQDNLGGEDNYYVYGDAEFPVVEGKLPLTAAAHLGYEDGAFSFGGGKLDWSAGVSTQFTGVTFGVAYVDTNVEGDNTDAAVVFTVGASF